MDARIVRLDNERVPDDFFFGRACYLVPRGTMIEDMPPKKEKSIS